MNLLEFARGPALAFSGAAFAPGLAFDDGQVHQKWDRNMESLLELVAGHLADCVFHPELI